MYNILRRRGLLDRPREKSLSRVSPLAYHVAIYFLERRQRHFRALTGNRLVAEAVYGKEYRGTVKRDVNCRERRKTPEGEEKLLEDRGPRRRRRRRRRRQRRRCFIEETEE